MRPKGFRGFFLLTVGQIVSIAGSAMTEFGLGIYIWKTTGNATPFSILTVSFFLPNLLFSTFAGALVDRLRRKISLILPDFSAAIITLMILILYVNNKLSLPVLYIASFFSGIFNTFQWPAYSVTLSTMVEEKDYARANGLFSLVETAPTLIAPILAGALINFIGLKGIFLIDILTCIFAILMVLYVEIPELKAQPSNESLLSDSVFGFKYIFKRKSLLSLLMVFLFTNLVDGFWGNLTTPMILSKFNNNSVILGTIQTIFGVGGILGSLIMSIWGGTKKKIYTLLFGIFLGGFASIIFGFSYSFVLTSFAAIIIGASNVFSNSASQSIWQSIVPVHMQGRVFSARRFIAQFISIIPMALSGPVVDRVLSKYFNSQNPLTRIFGYGKGASIGFLAVVAGVLVILIVIVSLLNPLVMNVENTKEMTKEVVYEGD